MTTNQTTTGIAMMMNTTIEQLRELRLPGMATGLQEQLSQASIEDLNTSAGRGLERKAVMSLALGDWVASGHSVLITGPTGVAVFVNKVVRFSKRLSPLFLATPHARAAGSPSVTIVVRSLEETNSIH